MTVTAGEVREPPVGPGGQAARPCTQLVVRCIPAHPEELHPPLIASRGYLTKTETRVARLPVYLCPLHCPVNAPAPGCPAAAA